MIVEDEIVLAMEIEENIRAMGYDCRGYVTTGEDAIAKAEEWRPDLLMMDIRLAGDIDGIEAARVIRENLRIPVIYLTAYADAHTLDRAKETEPLGYLIKPYSLRELRITLEMALHRAAIEAKLRESEERFKAVFDTAEDILFIKDASLKYTHVNPAMLKVFDLPESGLIGRHDQELLRPDEAQWTAEVEERVLQGQTVETEHSHVLGGRLIVCSFVRVPLRDSAGRINGLCAIGRDVTERSRMDYQRVRPSKSLVPDQYPSAAMQKTLRQVLLAARSDSICLFLGESGAGKDYWARYLHDHSSRAGGPFFALNCAALTPELAESELFGHEAGAFTGALGRKRGLLELAEGGTLMLNEVAELSLPLQSKLLTFLDTQTFTRVGGIKAITVNARLMAATNRSLDDEVAAGRFRSDLFFRINVIRIVAPSLRERMEDLDLLIKDILESLAQRMGLRSVPRVDPAAMDLLSRYQWPGNIRELQNVLERALILSGGRDLSAKDFGQEFGRSDAAESSLFAAVRITPGLSMNDAIREAKRRLVQDGLSRSSGSPTKAAKLLGISRDSFNYLLKSLDLRDE
jgi:PAS domain S-box-containing protein